MKLDDSVIEKRKYNKMKSKDDMLLQMYKELCEYKCHIKLLRKKIKDYKSPEKIISDNNFKLTFD